MIAWNPDGNSFSIKDNKQFVSQVLPKYFRHKKYESFIRQVRPVIFSSTCMASANRKTTRNLASPIAISRGTEKICLSISTANKRKRKGYLMMSAFLPFKK